jgi:hypothetical protein
LLLIVDPVRRQEIALPHPGIAASNLLSTSQSSFANKASGLRADVGGMGAEITSDRSREHKVTGESTLTCSTDRGKEGLAQIFWRSGIICNTGATTAAMASPSMEDGTEGKVDDDDELAPTRGDKHP